MSDEIKNTQPPVMTDKGPRNTTRKKSADGKYTAGGGTDSFSFEQEDEYKDRRRQFQAYSHGDEEDILNDNVYEPLFMGVMQRTLLKSLESFAGPNTTPFIIRSNTWNDKKLGIDYQIGLRYKDAKGNVTFNSKDTMNPIRTDLDLKVVNTFGKPYDYAHPQITLNLYKRYGNGEWEFNSFTNPNHENDGYCYLWPKCQETKKQILNKLKVDPNYRPEIEEAKMLWVDAVDLEDFVYDRILDSDEIKDIINAYKDRDWDYVSKHRLVKPDPYNKHSFEVNYPIPGTSFMAKITFSEQIRGDRPYQEVRMTMPQEITQGMNRIMNIANMK